MRNKLLILVLSFLVTACASTIGNKQDVKTTSFLIGDTSKNEVLDTLGLPSEVTRSEALQQEFWAYQDGPEFLGVIIAVPAGGTSTTTETISSGEAIGYDFKDAAAIYIFDKSETLIDVRYPNKEQ